VEIHDLRPTGTVRWLDRYLQVRLPYLPAQRPRCFFLSRKGTKLKQNSSLACWDVALAIGLPQLTLVLVEPGQRVQGGRIPYDSGLTPTTVI
jgi:hypothetical protein